MLTHEEFLKLCTAEVRDAIEAAQGRDPLAVAMDRKIAEARLVATQVKYLARAARKLPSYAAALCILPPRAFEQSSSEATAAHKALEGDAVLDLTCGLGVDALALSRRFRRVVALERDAVLAEVARENFSRLGVANIEVVNSAAEDYLATCRERFDWVYADPDRRSAEGRKMVRLEDCSPDVVSLRDRIAAIAPRLAVKNSPLFDVDEARRLFPTARIEVVSLHDECKEVNIYDDGSGPSITATALGKGSFSAAPDMVQPPLPESFDAAEYRYLIVPDVALQKARLVRRHLDAEGIDCWSDNGFGFARHEPQGLLGRVLAVEAIEPYDPRALKREMKGRGVELFRRDFPVAAEEVMRRMGAHPGGEHRMAVTKIGGDFWTIRLK